MRNMIVGNTIRLSVSSTGGEANGDSSKVQLNTTGTHATFSSKATNLASDDSNGFEDIFMHNLVTSSTVRASTNSEGGQANNASYNASVTDDGRYVVFESTATNLVPGDSNSVSDVFVEDFQTGIVRLVSESKSGQIGNEPSYNALSLQTDVDYSQATQAI